MAMQPPQTIQQGMNPQYPPPGQPIPSTQVPGHVYPVVNPNMQYHPQGTPQPYQYPQGTQQYLPQATQYPQGTPQITTGPLPQNISPVQLQSAPIIYQAPTKPNLNYNVTASKTLGWIQIVIGLICIISNSISMGFQPGRSTTEQNVAVYFAGGLWCSFFFILTGGLGIGAGKKKTFCLIVGTMVMCIISCLFAFTLLGLSSAIVGIENSPYYNTTTGRRVDRVPNAVQQTSLWTGVVMLISSFVEIFVCIVASVYCCAATCCKAHQAQTVHITQDSAGIRYITTGNGGQAIVVPAPAPVAVASNVHQPPIAQQTPVPSQQPPAQHPSNENYESLHDAPPNYEQLHHANVRLQERSERTNVADIEQPDVGEYLHVNGNTASYSEPITSDTGTYLQTSKEANTYESID